jgi:hypothetical protein
MLLDLDYCLKKEKKNERGGRDKTTEMEQKDTLCCHLQPATSWETLCSLGMPGALQSS